MVISPYDRIACLPARAVPSRVNLSFGGVEPIHTTARKRHNADRQMQQINIVLKTGKDYQSTERSEHEVFHIFLICRTWASIYAPPLSLVCRPQYWSRVLIYYIAALSSTFV
jgi:hypothetical protein